MNKKLIVMVTIALFSCGEAKEVNQPPTEEVVENHEPNSLINDIWVAETIMGLRFEPNGLKQPQLEFHIKENKVYGNDGCNSISTPIKKIDGENLTVGLITATKMACPDMSTSEKFHQALKVTKKYKIEKLRLYLFDENDEEVMVLKKVD